MARLHAVFRARREIEPDRNFFEAGFSSTLLAEVHDELRAQGEQLQLLDLFRYPTVRALAHELHRRDLAQRTDGRADDPGGLPWTSG